MSAAEPICPCGTFAHPRPPSNLPALASVRYRVGDFRSFRHALLLPLDHETQLSGWRPAGSGDLTMQLVEWWAYVADVLTFYSERVLNESLLRTCSLPESCGRIVRLLGYRPRPAVGATGTVAALLASSKSLTVPKGLKLRSKPGPGKQPQVFEVAEETAVSAPDAVDLDPIPSGTLITRSAGRDSILLAGSVAAVKAGDRVVVAARSFSGASGEWALGVIESVAKVKDPRGRPATRLTFTATLGAIPLGALAASYRVLGSPQTARPYGYANGASSALQTGQVHLDAVARTIVPGDLVLLEDSAPAPLTPTVARVTANREVVWYTNASGAPQTPPAAPTAPIVAVHSQLDLTPALPSAWSGKQLSAVVRHTWVEVGTPVGAAPETVSTAPSPLVLAGERIPPQLSGGQDVILEDATGAGVPAAASAGTSAGTVRLTALPDPATTLVAPLRALTGRVPVSRGETVAGEVLGSGDQSAAGQELTLKKAPLTYLPGGSVTGSPGTNLTGLASTLRVYVDRVEWTEVPTFFGTRPHDRVFVTREDDDGKTHVMFGDGVYGARLPTGRDNVTADYRYGGGAAAPAPGELTVIADPLPNLKAVRNPVAVGGGADPDPPTQLKRYAPRSVLTFGRAVSADDYEAIAAEAPGVRRARADWTWSDVEQRSLVMVWVGDDANAVESARGALELAGDPNRPVLVEQATPVDVYLFVALKIADDRKPAPVIDAVRDQLVDAEIGLFGEDVVRIGKPVYVSEVHAACLAVPGVVAARCVCAFASASGGTTYQTGFRYEPGPGAFFRMPPANLYVFEGA